MSRIYWDSMLFIYWLEDHPKYGSRVKEIHDRMEKRGDTLCTSALAVGEVLAGPYRHGSRELVEQIRQFFSASQVEVLAFEAETADHYARIRAEHRVAPADAIHLAAAARRGVHLFLTNDHRLRRLAIPGIDFVAAMDVDLF